MTTQDAATATSSTTPTNEAPERRPAWHQRALPSAALLLLLYAGLSLTMTDQAFLGTDTGAKVATIHVMSEAGVWSPEVPYWADEWDPDGEVHSFYQAVRNDRGGWVSVTTVPMLLVARPLYDVGGLRLALVVPMLGSVGAALAARALASRLGATDRGSLAFWATGLGSAVTIYALDFWEHSLGVAALAWGFVALTDAILGRSPVLRGLLAGLAFGIGATMRNESLVFAAAGFAVTCFVLLRRDGVRSAALVGASGIAGFAAPYLANVGLGHVVHSGSRVERATTTASGAAGALDQRVEEAFQTLLAINTAEVAVAVVLGAGVVLAVVLGTRFVAKGERRLGLVCFAVPIAILGREVATGLTFVPGLLMATPAAILGLLALDDRPGRRELGATVALALPMVWATQYLGGAGPQWGGRYILTAGLLLAVLGLTARPEVVPRTATVAVVAIAGLVTAMGIGWSIERRSDVTEFFDAVLAQPEDIVIATNAFLPREAGPRIFDAQFLGAVGEAGLAKAGEVALASGACEVGVIGYAGEPPRAELLGEDAALREERSIPQFGLRTGYAVYDLC